MNKISKSLFVFIGIICTVSFFSGSAYEVKASNGSPLPPPVNIEFTVENIPIAGEEVVLKFKVTPFEDMHADISCLLPEGIKLIREKGVFLRPYRDRHLFLKEEPHTIYMEAVGLWVGPLKGGVSKEFVFRVIIPNKGRYEFIAVVEALAKWGVKQETLVIDID